MTNRRDVEEQREHAHERLVPAPEFASRLSIQRRTLGNWLKDGTVPSPIRINGRLYWRETVVEAFLKALGGKQ
jgi:predicted DNA-binding transcriptional regulator AlpA